MTEYERFSLVFTETRVYKFGHRSWISLMFRGIILRVLGLEVSIYNVYIPNQFQTTFAQVGGVKSVTISDSE